MYGMYSTPGPYFQQFLGIEVRLRHNYLEDEEEIFLCTYVNMLLYKKQKRLGMLSPFAQPFYPSTEYRMEISTNKTKVTETEKRDKKVKTKKNLKLLL